MLYKVERIYEEEMMGDTSFQEKIPWYCTNTYSQFEVREIWEKGIKHGIEIGLKRAYEEVQVSPQSNHRNFIDEVYKLSDKYNCKIIYHPIEGMIVTDKN